MLTHREEENFNTRVLSKNLSFQDIYIESFTAKRQNFCFTENKCRSFILKSCLH